MALRMGVRVGFIQNLIRAKRTTDMCVWVGAECSWRTGWLAAALKGFVAQVPSCSPDCWGPCCSRGGSDGGRFFLAEGSARQEWTSSVPECLPLGACPLGACPASPAPWLVRRLGIPVFTCLHRSCGTRENPPALGANIQSLKDLSTQHPPPNLKPYRNSIFPGPGVIASLTKWGLDA